MAIRGLENLIYESQHFSLQERTDDSEYAFKSLVFQVAVVQRLPMAAGCAVGRTWFVAEGF